MNSNNNNYNNSNDQNNQTDQSDDKTLTNSQIDKIKDVGSLVSSKGKHSVYCLTIVGEIEGHIISPAQNKTTKYEHVIPQLVVIEEDPEIEGLIVVLNTVGGDVEAGLAIAELIAGMSKPTVSLVIGGGHSIGVPLAVSANKSFIVPSATMTIHPVRMTGLVLGVPQTLNYFEKMQDRITSFVTANSNISKERFTEFMMNTGEMVTDVGSVLNGQTAVDEGLIDNLGSLNDALTCLYSMIENRQDKTQNS